MLQLLGLLVTAGLLSPCMAETFHVTPTLPALADLEQYAKHGNLSGHSNITLIFLEGVHNLSDYLTGFIILQPAIPNQGQRPKIIGRCDTNNGGSLFTITALNTLIEGLLFENVSLELYYEGVTDLDVSSITIKNSIISRSTHTSVGVNAYSVKNYLIEDTTSWTSICIINSKYIKCDDCQFQHKSY